MLLAPASTHQGNSLLTTVKVWPLRVNLSYLKKTSRIVGSQALVMGSVSKTGGWKMRKVSSHGPQLISFHWKGFKCLYFHVDSEQHVDVCSIYACEYVCMYIHVYESISQSLSISFTDVGFQSDPQRSLMASLARKPLFLPFKPWNWLGAGGHHGHLAFAWILGVWTPCHTLR